MLNSLINRTLLKKLLVQAKGPALDRLLRNDAKAIAGIYYRIFHSPKPFIPGKSKIQYAGRYFDREELGNLTDATLDFWLTSGRFEKEFAEKLSDFLGIKYAITTNSGSSANLLAISALTSPKLGHRRLIKGDEIITLAAGFPTTVTPIVQNGLIPVFVDVELGTYNAKIAEIAKAITGKTKAIFMAHTLGIPFEVDKVRQIADKHNLWLIEDNCDALGAKYKGKYTGTFGHMATLSFYPAHHITTGEGGAVITNDPKLKTIISSFRDWGRDCWCDPGCDNSCGNRFKWQLGKLPYAYDHKYTYSHLGYNLKMTDMQAAIGVAQIKKLASFIKSRRHNWDKLYQIFKPYSRFFILPECPKNAEASPFGFVLTLKDGIPFTREDIVNYLENNGIQTRMVFAGNIIRQSMMDGVKHKVSGNLKNTDKVMTSTFWVGVYPGITDKMMVYIKQKVAEFINKYK